MSPGIGIGIDLGTTNCVVAVYKEDEYGGGADVVQNDIGGRSTPSVVAILEAERLVGEAAVLQAPMNPANTIRNAKRVLGVSFKYAIEDKSHLGAVELVEDETRDGVSFRVNQRDFAPEEVVAMILRPLVEAAQLQLGSDEARVVIAVPPYFSHVQRLATIHAGFIAGVKDVDLVNETTAAALTFASSRETALKAIIIDIGGGGTSLSVVETHPDGRVEVLAASGYRLPGGDFMDALMISRLAQKITEKHKKDVCEDPRAFEILRKSWQEAKIKLSRLPQTKIDTFLPGVEIHLQEVVDIEEFKSVCSDSFSSAFKDVLQVTLDDAKVSKDGIDDVVFVGRASRTPWLKSLLQDMLDCPTPCRGINPDEAVACGAALYAVQPSRLLREINTHSFGIVTKDGTWHQICENNRVVPDKIFRLWQPSLPNIWKFAENNTQIVFDLMTILAPKRVLGHKYELEFVLRRDGRVTLHHDESLCVGNVLPQSLNNDRVRNMLEEAKAHLHCEKAHNARLEARNALENVCRELKHKVVTVQDEAKKNFCLSLVEEALNWLKENESVSVDEYNSRYETVKSHLDKILEGIRAAADNERRLLQTDTPSQEEEQHPRLNQEVDANAGQEGDHRNRDQEGMRQQPRSRTNVSQDEGRRSPPQQHRGPSGDAPHPTRGARVSPSHANPRAFWVTVEEAEKQLLDELTEWGESGKLPSSRDISKGEPQSASSSGGTRPPSPASDDVRMDFEDGEKPSPDIDAYLQHSLKELHLHVLRSELSRDGGSETGLVFMPAELLDHHDIFLTSLAAELRRVAAKEVRAAGRAALLVDTIQHYTSMMLRYVQSSGAIVERLIALLPKRLATAQGLLTALKDFFDEGEMDWKRVVTSMSMDASASMAHKYNALIQLMREERGAARGVRLLWNCSHQLDDFIAQTCCARNGALAIFFGKLEALKKFFLSPERLSWLVKNGVAVDEDTLDCYENLVSFVLSNRPNIVKGLKLFVPKSDPQTVFLIDTLVDALSDDFLFLCLHFNHIFSKTRHLSGLLLNACGCEEALMKAREEIKTFLDTSYKVNLKEEAHRAGIQVGKYVRVHPLDDAVHAVLSALADTRLRSAVENLSRMGRVHQFVAANQSMKKPRMTYYPVLSTAADVQLVDMARQIQPSESACGTVLHLMQFERRSRYRQQFEELYDSVQELCTLPLIPASGSVRKLATLRDRLRGRGRMGHVVLEAIMVIVGACDDVFSTEKALLKDYSSVVERFHEECGCMRNSS